MDIRSSFIANPQTAELVKPTVRAFDHPAKHAQTTAVFLVAFGEHRSNATPPQSLAMGFGIVRSIALNALRSSPLSAFAADFGNRVHQRDQLRYIVRIGPGQRGRQGDAVGIGEHVMLRARFAAIRGIRARLRPQKPPARTCCPRRPATSRFAWRPPIAAATRNGSSPIRLLLASRGAAANRSCPIHIPFPLGKYSHGMPVLRTNRIPVSTERLSFGFRPGFRRRRFLGGGSNGSISFHNSSSKIGLAMIVPPCTARQYSQNSRAFKSPFC